MKKILLPLLSLGFATSSASAADLGEPKKVPSAKLGEPGTFSLAVEGSLGAPSPRVDDHPTRGADITLRPVVDVFVARRVSLGASLPLEYHVPNGEGAPSPWLGVVFPTLRGGFLVPISERVQLWPGLQFGCGFAAAGAPFAPRCTPESILVAADARIAVEVFSHAYVSVSPIVARVGFFDGASSQGTFGPVFLSSNMAVSAVF